MSFSYSIPFYCLLVLSKFFKSIFYWLCYYICLIFFLSFITRCPAPSLPPALSHLSSRPWVVHISSLASTSPILFLTSPLSILYLPIMFLIPCTFSFILFSNVRSTKRLSLIILPNIGCPPRYIPLHYFIFLHRLISILHNLLSVSHH